MSISLVAVFTPILLMGGMVGRLFREFAVTLSVAILISLVVSLTTTPMMCATILKQETTRAHGFLYRATEWIFDHMRSTYDKSLRWALRHSLIMALHYHIHARDQCGVVLVHSQGLFPRPGHRTHQRPNAGGAGYLFSGHE